MLIIKNNNNGKDLNDFWLENTIINCCDVVKHKQSPIKTNNICINELYNEFDDTYTNPSEKLKKTNNVLIFDNNKNYVNKKHVSKNYVNKNYVNKKYGIKNKNSNNKNFISNNFRETTN
jgi:hypothetical protein